MSENFIVKIRSWILQGVHDLRKIIEKKNGLSRSGNFDVSQGIVHFLPRVREMSGNFEKTGL